MNRHMRDDEFETLLGHALRAEAAPAGLGERILGDGMRRRRPHFLAVMLSPARIAACAGMLSLLVGFALGAGNAAVADGGDGDISVALYAASDLGDI